MKHTRPLDISGRVSTGDPNLACALLTNGVPLDERNPISKIKADTGDFIRFHFKPSTVDGKRRTAELSAAWDAGEDHIRAFPDDGMSYCMAFALNRRALMTMIHEREPMVMIRKGKQIAIISEKANISTQAEILGRIES